MENKTKGIKQYILDKIRNYLTAEHSLGEVAPTRVLLLERDFETPFSTHQDTDICIWKRILRQDENSICYSCSGKPEDALRKTCGYYEVLR